MDNGNIEEFLEQIPVETEKERQPPSPSPSPSHEDQSTSTRSEEFRIGDTVQWMCLPDSKFCGSGPTQKIIQPGSYRPAYDNKYGLTLEFRLIKTDDIIRFPNSVSDLVLESIKTFWTKKQKFKEMGHLFKRGILLWGPPGGGKTVTIALLTEDLIRRGGIVIHVTNPELAIDALELIRKVQPETSIICVLEDIDEMINEYSEHLLLSLLDGENQVGNVVHVGTTNYPQFLPSRFVNRPSRFDEIIKVGLPNRKIRELYLIARGIDNSDLKDWVKETDGLSIAHLRELMIAVYCLGRDKSETIMRLKAMANKIKSDSELNVGY